MMSDMAWYERSDAMHRRAHILTPPGQPDGNPAPSSDLHGVDEVGRIRHYSGLIQQRLRFIEQTTQRLLENHELIMQAMGLPERSMYGVSPHASSRYGVSPVHAQAPRACENEVSSVHAQVPRAREGGDRVERSVAPPTWPMLRDGNLRRVQRDGDTSRSRSLRHSRRGD